MGGLRRGSRGKPSSLRDLHARAHRGAYRARPSRRVFIPKPDGRLRPLGVAALEDKILQRALAEVLNAIYETDFLGFSYGFRPGRGPHHALDALAAGIVGKKVNWVLDADFSDYFSSLDHQWLEPFLEHRIADRRVLRLIQKWLAAGVMENGSWTAFEEGVPQGASFPRCSGTSTRTTSLICGLTNGGLRTRTVTFVIVRFADDFVVGFEHREDAERFSIELRDSFSKFGLELNAEKARLIEFGRHSARDRAARGLGKPETFRFLGFTHICGRRRTPDGSSSRGTPTQSGCVASCSRSNTRWRSGCICPSRAGALARQRPVRELPLLRGARQHRGAHRLPQRDRPALAQDASASQPAPQADLETDGAPR